MMGKTLFRIALVAMMAAPAAGCAAAAVGAGAAAGIHLTSQGAEGVASEPVASVSNRTRTVLESEGIRVTGTENEEGGTEMEFRGRKGEMQVHVKLEARESGGTIVRASARTGPTAWRKDYARTLVQRITGG
jgi:hypothetical protein